MVANNGGADLRAFATPDGSLSFLESTPLGVSLTTVFADSAIGLTSTTFAAVYSDHSSLPEPIFLPTPGQYHGTCAVR
jgi:hypothetical protein